MKGLLDVSAEPLSFSGTRRAKRTENRASPKFESESDFGGRWNRDRRGDQLRFSKPETCGRWLLCRAATQPVRRRRGHRRNDLSHLGQGQRIVDEGYGRNLGVGTPGEGPAGQSECQHVPATPDSPSISWRSWANTSEGRRAPTSREAEAGTGSHGAAAPSAGFVDHDVGPPPGR